MAVDEGLVKKTAVEIVNLLKRGEVTPADLLDTLEARVAAVDDKVNALPTLCFDRARSHLDGTEGQGPLYGLPVAIKDLSDVAGVRTTYGSMIFEHHVPDRSENLVERLEGNGGVVYAKSNTPEFGAGANTFNDVFGYTRNPWDTALSAAGSSGGAAVALATGMAWIAHGSDMGGSLRNPASFCGVVGMRPSIGRVAHDSRTLIDDTLGADGPMARNVADLALMLDAMVGEDPRDLLSLPRDGANYLDAARRAERPARVAFSADLGITPVDPQVATIVRAAADKLAASGVVVEEAHPDLSEAHDCFNTLRAVAFAANLSPLLDQHRDVFKPEIVWNIEKGLELTAAEIVKAEARRAELCRRTRDFFETYDILLTPATIVPPYPVEQRFVEQCNGVTFDNYVHWLAIAYAITLVGCPSVALPAGFTDSGLPVGIQVIADSRADAHAISAAAHLEQVLGLGAITPIDPRVRH